MRTSLYVFLLLSVAMPINAFGAPDAEMEQELPEVDIVETVPEQPRLPMIEIEERAPVTYIDIDTDKLRPAPRYDNGNQNLEQDSGVETSEATPRKNKKNSDKDLTELQKNVEDARANETSLKNKTIDAVGIGGVGIGGMMIGEALSEQDADEDIERQMNAYINTFRCEYGNYPAVAGGKTNIELPGGNDLFNLYAQYATLSNDLKIRKEALGIKPGIESEVVWDKAETGLYDDVGTGIVAGSYASVARALLLGGADAAAWTAQKDATAEKLKTGVIIAGAGAVGSALANLTYNGRHKDNPLKELEETINSLPPDPTCPDGTVGTTYPKCKCQQENYLLNPNRNECEPCAYNGQIVTESDDGKSYVCKCPDGKYEDGRTKQCSPYPVTCEYLESTDGNKKTVQYRDCSKSWTCENGYAPDYDNNICVCKGENMREREGKCEYFHKENRQHKDIVRTINAKLDNKALFDTNQSSLRPDASAEINKFVTNHLETPGMKDCVSIAIIGYADPQGKPEPNQTLSEKRAKTVYDYLVNKTNIKKYLSEENKDNIYYQGRGETNCKCQEGNLKEGCEGKQPNEFAHPDKAYTPCRRVEIQMICPQTDTSHEESVDGQTIQ